MNTTLIIIVSVIVVLVVCLTIANTAERSFNRKYKKYSSTMLNTTFTAGEFASRLITDSGYKNLKLAYTDRELEDAFSSKHNTIILSRKTLDSYSVAGYATVAHEFGHAVQYNSGQISYKFLKLSKVITYVFGNFSFPLMIAGVIMLLIDSLNELGNFLLIAGGVIFIISLIAQLLTIPIEFGASNIGLKKLKDYDFLEYKEYKMARKFLKSAGLTYVAAFLSRILAWTFMVPKYKM